jgi:hypothetical protein
VSWVTVADALTYTGQNLTDEELALASSMITVYSGALEAQPEDSITARDRLWLAMATAYQAAWVKGKPSVLAYRESHTQTSADGVNVTRESDSQIMLAPMAARCLRNLSWVGNTTRHSPPALDPRTRAAFPSETSDAYHDWKSRPIT